MGCFWVECRPATALWDDTTVRETPEMAGNRRRRSRGTPRDSAASFLVYQLGPRRADFGVTSVWKCSYTTCCGQDININLETRTYLLKASGPNSWVMAGHLLVT